MVLATLQYTNILHWKTIDDFSITFVDAIAGDQSTERAVRRTVSIRKENDWITDLDAKINVKRNLPFSFTGYEGASKRGDGWDDQELVDH